MEYNLSSSPPSCICLDIVLVPSSGFSILSSTRAIYVYRYTIYYPQNNLKRLTLYKMRMIHELFLAAITGIASHLGFFIRGEYHLQGPWIFRYYLVLIGVLFLVQTRDKPESPREAGKVTLLIVITYSIALFLSMTIYRTVFYPLHGFPGPSMAKVTKFWNVANSMDSGNFRLMDKLHQQYGDFVRTGKSHSLLRAQDSELRYNRRTSIWC